MLASPEANLVEREQQLPGLAVVLDPGELAARAAAEGMRLPAGLDVCYIRFKPSTSCLVGYRPRGSSEPPSFYANAFTRRSGKLEKSPKRPLWPTSAGKGRITIDECAVEVCAFPNDDHLHTVGCLYDNDQAPELLQSLIGSHSGAAHIDVRPVAYKPERRSVFRISVDGVATASIKVYAKPRYRESLRNASLVSGARHARFPRMLGSSETRSAIGFEWLDGQVLAEMLSEPQPDFHKVRETGTALARFHQWQLEGASQDCRLDASARIDEAADAIANLLPESSERICSVAERLRAALLCEAIEQRALHGDFYAHQVLVQPGGIALLDSDSVSVGNRAMDIGNFIAQLEAAASRGDIPASVASSATSALLEGYSVTADLPGAGSVELWTAVGLLRVSLEPFRQYRDDWSGKILSLVSRVEALLDLSSVRR